MKRTLIAVLALSLLGAAGALAGKGGPIIAGAWGGWGEAIYPDGTTADIVVDRVDIYQKGNFVYGNSQISVTVDTEPPLELSQVGQLSGYIHGNVLKGSFGGCITEAPDCLGAAIFEGKITGKTISGTVIDLSDGSTGVVTLHRVAD